MPLKRTLKMGRASQLIIAAVAAVILIAAAAYFFIGSSDLSEMPQLPESDELPEEIIP